MLVYIDDKNMCHREFKEGYVEASHPYFDTIPPLAIECYKFIPERNFIQCVYGNTENAYQRQYREDNEIFNIIMEGTKDD